MDQLAANALADLMDYASAAVPNPKNPEGWTRRSLCDECREELGFSAVNLAVPEGCPILCGPCAFKPEVAKRWSDLQVAAKLRAFVIQVCAKLREGYGGAPPGSHKEVAAVACAIMQLEAEAGLWPKK